MNFEELYNLKTNMRYNNARCILVNNGEIPDSIREPYRNIIEKMDNPLSIKESGIYEYNYDDDNEKQVIVLRYLSGYINIAHLNLGRGTWSDDDWLNVLKAANVPSECSNRIILANMRSKPHNMPDTCLYLTCPPIAENLLMEFFCLLEGNDPTPLYIVSPPDHSSTSVGF